MVDEGRARFRGEKRSIVSYGCYDNMTNKVQINNVTVTSKRFNRNRNRSRSNNYVNLEIMKSEIHYKTDLNVKYTVLLFTNLIYYVNYIIY